MYWTNGLATLYQADARSIPLPDESCHCVVTSPPYWMQRVYQGNDERGIGLEDSVEAWIGNLLDVFREVRRVMHPTGLLWLNLGDKREESQKLAIPERFALAMQADGWIWRDTVIWHKKSPMPESVNGTRWERCKTMDLPQLEQRIQDSRGEIWGMPSGGRDSFAQWSNCPGCAKCESTDGYVLRRGSWRCTNSYEYIFMFAKSPGYWSDGEGVKTDAIHEGRVFKATGASSKNAGNINNPARGFTNRDTVVHGANRRNVWSDIKPEPFAGSHYATFPPDLPRLCIQASTSEKGVCPSCGSQWARVIQQARPQSYAGQGDHVGDSGNGMRMQEKWTTETKTIGWRPTCTCVPHDPIPATVLDPFAGTGTTLLAAQRLGRRSYGTDISREYLDMAVNRLQSQSLPLPGLAD